MRGTSDAIALDRDWLQRQVAVVLFTALLLAGVPAVAFSLPEPAAIGDRLAEVLVSDPVSVQTVAVGLDGPASAALTDTIAGLGLESYAFTNFDALVVRGPAASIEALQLAPGVTGLWLDHQLEQVMAESRTVIGAEQVQTELGFDGAGVGIAVIDSGIEATHLDLEYGTKTVQNVKIVGAQGTGYSGPLTALAVPVEDVPDTDLTTGHGTHVAGIAAGNGARSNGRLRGVAPGAHLVGLSAGDVYLVTTLAAYDWLLSHHEEYGVRVLNNSWADGSIAYDPGHPLNLASKAAYDAGIVVVQAAGNDGQGSGDVYNRYAAPEWVLGVGGVDKLGRLGSYSSRGTVDRHVDVMAPGSFIASTMAVTGLSGAPNQTPFDLTDPNNPRMLQPNEMPYYTVKMGSSMAAPHVAGLAALVLQAVPTLTPQQVMDVIIESATPIAGCAVVDCGAGLVNATAAIAAAQLLTAPVLQAPVAALTVAPASGEAPLDVTLDATGSTDADGVVVGWDWDLDGDGEVDASTTTGVLTHTFEVGRHTVAVTVIDDDGLRSATLTAEVVASNAPSAAAVAPAKADSGEVVTFDASASTDDGSIVSYRFDLGDGTVVEQSSPVLTHVYATETNTRFTWQVTVTDDTGLSDTVADSIKVKKPKDS